MSISSHKQKTKKNSFQRKVQALQLERDELREKLLEYESELAGQIERFNSAEQEYKSKIYRLERKLQLQRHEETPILQTRIMNWIFFGVVCSILPLVMSILYIWFLGYITPELEHRKSGYVERKRRPYQGNVVRIA